MAEKAIVREKKITSIRMQISANANGLIQGPEIANLARSISKISDD